MTPKNEWIEQDFYQDLGVNTTASEAEIKKAYRKIARENHPDSNPGNKAAEEKFKRAAQAYDVLGNESKRKEYDEFRALLASNKAHGYSTQAGFDFSDLGDFLGAARARQGNFSDTNLGDIFGTFFNRDTTRAYKPRSPRPTRGADVETDVTLEFREAAQGTTIPLKLTGDAPCTTCHGSGSQSAKKTTCTTCSGTGFTSENRGAFGFSAPCTDCDGTGTKITDPCLDCDGKGTVHKTRSITVRIPVGVIDGQKVRLAGQGEAGPHGAPAGDLFVNVKVKPDPIFTRSGDDLEVTVPVSFTELTLGETISVPTLEHSVRLKIPAGTPNGRVLRVRGRGIAKRGGETGDLLVKVEVVIPTDLDPAAMSTLRSFAQTARDAGYDPRAGWAGA
ncbi:molecular chaperone DnaJ [Corynebacterium sp. sy039]|uniref:molecular chaperone DnaJ n=1 Tax=Corynebacterium sp. sy039 TaxID=2599641 RepID=UPI0011B62151|nr:molecular chaperone DnaJ [Corynebacterium sp. sy039]QDZ41853.1 molecular chaperone DnaJ [Corynebacterium sp. sy039]